MWAWRIATFQFLAIFDMEFGFQNKMEDIAFNIAIKLNKSIILKCS